MFGTKHRSRRSEDTDARVDALAVSLLGDWNWFLPKWLEWLPRLEQYEPTTEPRQEVMPAHVPALTGEG